MLVTDRAAVSAVYVVGTKEPKVEEVKFVLPPCLSFPHTFPQDRRYHQFPCYLLSRQIFYPNNRSFIRR